MDFSATVTDSTLLVALPVAFGAGIVSVLSPCVFPLIPGYVAFISQGESSGTRPIVRAGAFVAGFTVLFTLVSVSALSAAQALAEWRDVILLISGVTLTALGALMMLGRLGHGGSGRLTARLAQPTGIVGAAFVGAVFAIAMAPCYGPVLGAIVTLAGAIDGVWRGLALMIAYSLGLGVPFLIAGVSLDAWLRHSARLRRWIRPIQIASGAILIVVGVLVATGEFTRMSLWLYRSLPGVTL